MWQEWVSQALRPNWTLQVASTIFDISIIFFAMNCNPAVAKQIDIELKNHPQSHTMTWISVNSRVMSIQITIIQSTKNAETNADITFLKTPFCVLLGSLTASKTLVNVLGNCTERRPILPTSGDTMRLWDHKHLRIWLKFVEYVKGD